MKLDVRKAAVLVVLTAACAWPMIAWAVDPAHDPHATATPPNTVAHGDPHALPAGAGEHGEEHAGGEHGHWPPAGLNWTDLNDKDRPPFIAMLVNFAILAGAYYALGKKPVAEALKTRRSAVAKEIEDAERMKKEAEARAEQYQAKLSRLEDELATARAALVEAGKGEKERIVREAEEKATRLQKETEFLVEQEVRQMQQDLMRGAVERATAAAEDLLRKRVTQADQERLAEEYLADLAKRPAAKGGLS